MKASTLLTYTASGLFLCLAQLSAVAADSPAMPGMDHAKPGMDHANMGNMPAMAKTGDVDYDFATMMRQHHQMGINMAQKQIKEGKNPEMKQMAQKIVDAQTKEIAQFDAWLAKNKPVGTGAGKSGN